MKLGDWAAAVLLDEVVDARVAERKARDGEHSRVRPVMLADGAVAHVLWQLQSSGGCLANGQQSLGA